DWAERDIIRIFSKRAVEFLMAVGRDAEFEPGSPDRGRICLFEIALAEMDEPRAAVDGVLPIIVHDKLATIAFASFKRAPDRRRDLRGGCLLHTQLNELHANRGEALNPREVRDDGIEFRKHGSRTGRQARQAGSTGLPCRGAA